MPSGPKVTTITSSFDEINKKIKTLNGSIRNAQKDAKDLQEALKIEPKNVELAQARYNALGEAVEAAKQKITLNAQKLEELNNQYKDKSSDTYKEKLRGLTEEARKFQTQLKALEVQQREAKKAIDMANGGLDKQEKELKRGTLATKIYEQTTRAVKVAVLGFFTAVTTLTKQMSELGKELVSNADKYDTTVYKLQEQSYLFRTLTGNADAYTQSLQALNSVLAQILSGRGQSQLESLKQIGLTESDVTGKSTAEAYEVIFRALRDVGDQATATAVAVKLFGDAGSYVAEMAYKSEAEFNKYAEQFRQVGGVSEESAKKLAQLSNDLELLKYQAQATGAEIIVELAPAINGFLSIILDLAKGIGKLYDAFGSVFGSMVLLTTFITIKLIPSIIKVIIQHKLETAAVREKTAATLAYISVATVGVGAILAIAGAAASSAIATNNAADSMEDYASAVEQANDTVKKFNDVSEQMNKDLSVSSEAVSTYNSSYNAEVKFIIQAEGDTAISGETAKNVGEITADYVNKVFGGITA